jgi:hypothetical protein
MNPVQLTDKEQIEFFKKGMEQANHRADVWAKSARLWRDFASRVDAHPQCPEDLKIDYQKTMLADSP